MKVSVCLNVFVVQNPGGKINDQASEQNEADVKNEDPKEILGDISPGEGNIVVISVDELDFVDKFFHPNETASPAEINSREKCGRVEKLFQNFFALYFLGE